MWDDIQAFIETMIDRYGLFKIVIGPYLVISTLCGFGLLTRSPVVMFVAVAMSFMTTLTLLVYASWKWRSLRTILSERSRTLTRYVDRFARNLEAAAFTIEDWEERVVVSRGGNTIFERWITVKVGPEALYSWWTANYSAVPEVMGKSQTRRVSVQVRSFDESRSLGARYDASDEWQGNKHRIFVHFAQPAKPGEIINLWVQWSWPGFHKSTLFGEAVPVEWLLHHEAKRISSTTTFDASTRLKNLFGITPYRGLSCPTQERLPDGSIVIRVEYADVVAGSLVGYTLDGQDARRQN